MERKRIFGQSIDQSGGGHGKIEMPGKKSIFLIDPLIFGIVATLAFVFLIVGVFFRFSSLFCFQYYVINMSLNEDLTFIV